ncbi:MAG: TetR/AcrR family transcriptional regulator [Nocardioides sp.]
MPEESRRDALLAACTDHVLAEGLIGLSLRPLAKAVGTSDRMLIYHFGSRDGLVAAIIDESTNRSVGYLQELTAPPSVRAGVLRLWQAYHQAPLHACNLIYVQAAVSGYLGQEPYRSSVRDSNARWAAAMRDWFERCGAPRGRLDRIAQLVESALLGFHVDLATDSPTELERGVADLADAVQVLAG